MNRKKAILEVSYQSQACLAHENIAFKNAQNKDFFKGVSPWFGSKISNFVKVSFYAKYNEKSYVLTLSFENKPFYTIETGI